MSNTTVDNEVFRDRISTVTKEGKRNWLYPLQPKGRLYNLRTIFSIVFLVLFFGLPFLRIHDQPVFLFNILERKFIFFSLGEKSSQSRRVLLGRETPRLLRNDRFIWEWLLLLSTPTEGVILTRLLA